ncbi:PLP-dependent aminotransferase family protein [Labrys sp. LIt4]|uniref:MocR-like pyridoxine biosynthesis transcription factor PdxR n=1 Tax=Labrys sp. LIt4 TaxID=2821355 RepID=UPI001FD7E30F|nr:PLP-dependent aminotransferase family protein [Labrys sp. LIt4]
MSDWSTLMPVLPGRGPRRRELYVAMRRLIETGLAQPGAKLPTTRDLAKRLGLSRAAAVAAFEMLVADGFVEARIGAGTFVAAQVPAVWERRAGPSGQRPASPALPCELGVATLDDKTMRVFRGLLSRNLAQPGPEHFRYGDPRGGSKLREAITAYLRAARGVRCDAEQIVVTTGTMHGLDLIVRTILKPGDAAWIEDPCYPLAKATLEAAGARLIGVPVDGEGIDAAGGEKRGAEARLVYVTPSHQFPLGVAMTMRRRLALIDWAKRNDAWIVEDDYDSEFRFSGPPLTALQGMDGADRVAYLGTFSKVLFPGIRIGYAVLPEALLDRVLRLRTLSDRQPPTLVHGAVADFLNDGHFAAHLRRARRRVQAARDGFVAALRQHCAGELDFAVPEHGLHLVARLANASGDRDLVRRLFAEGVGARALSPMYLSAPARQGLVLGFSGFGAVALESAAGRIGDVLRDFLKTSAPARA